MHCLNYVVFFCFILVSLCAKTELVFNSMFNSPYMLRFSECSQTSFVAVVKCGSPNADWCTLTIMEGETPVVQLDHIFTASNTLFAHILKRFYAPAFFKCISVDLAFGSNYSQPIGGSSNVLHNEKQVLFRTSM